MVFDAFLKKKLLVQKMAGGGGLYGSVSDASLPAKELECWSSSPDTVNGQEQ